MKAHGVVFVLSMGASACASRPAAPATDTPATGAPEAGVSSEEPLDLDDAARRFEQAEQEIGTLFAAADKTKDADAAGKPTMSNRDETAPMPQAPPPDVAQSRPPDRCDRACRALRSMKRSADRLCELTGGDDPRCSDVLARYERAGRRVRDACAECGG